MSGLITRVQVGAEGPEVRAHQGASLSAPVGSRCGRTVPAGSQD